MRGMSGSKPEFWTYGHAKPRGFARQAQNAEAQGWDGVTCGESQNLTGDPFVAMGIAAHATTTIKMATSVAITATRHPATTACAAATCQEESGGRIVLGIGTGDSATAHLGLRPAPLRSFTRYLERLQGYLRGEDVPFDVETDGRGEIPSYDAMGMKSAPTASRLRWLDPTVPKVPVDVAASGPKTIAMAARVGDAVGFAVGANAARIKWAVDLARTSRQDAGLDPDSLPLGAYMPLFCHPDQRRARELISGTVASFAHLSSMYGTISGPADEAQQKVLTAVRDNYQMEAHQTYNSPQSRILTDDVVDTFAIAGPPSLCIERLQEMVELGISKFIFVGYSFEMDPDEARASRRRIAEEIIPAFR
jgi:5,10-methylenetetrahydromethanopterin reductase